MIRLEKFLKTSLQDVLKMSWWRLQNVLKTSWRCLEDVFARRLEEVLNTSWKCLSKTSWRRLQDILKTFLQDVWKTSWRRFEDILARRLEDALKTSSEDVYGKYIWLDENVLKTSWRHPLKTKTKDVFKTSWRRLHQDECLLGSFLFVNATKIYQFKAKYSEIKDVALCLSNISKDFTINNMKKQD